MKFFTITLILVCVYIALNADVMTGTYTLSGKVYRGNEILANDSIMVIYHYSKKKVTGEDIYYVHTNSYGHFRVKVDWTIPCGSSNFSNCNDLSEDSCFHLNSLKWNPEVISFVYGNDEIKVVNQYWSYYKQNLYDQTIEQDLKF